MKHKGKVEPAPMGLVLVGPLVEVTLLPHPAIASALERSGKKVPVKVVRLMVDTGAQSTVIEKRIAEELQLQPIRYMDMVGVSQKPQKCPVYRMTIALRMEDKSGNTSVAQFVSDVIGMESPSRPMDHVGLLGRDFLSYVKLNYDGPSGTFEIVDVPKKARPASLAKRPEQVGKHLADRIENRRLAAQARKKAQLEAQRRTSRKKKRRKRKPKKRPPKA